GLRARVDDAAGTVEILEHEAVDERADRLGREWARHDLAAVIVQPALELRRELRLHRCLAGDDHADTFGICGGGDEAGEREDRDVHEQFTGRWSLSCAPRWSP